jgi:hypothetical protein
MNRTLSPLPLLGLGALALSLLSGCGHSAKPTTPPPLSIEQVPQALETAFKDAPASQAANQIAVSVQNNDPAALSELQELSARADLNESQRIAAARAMAAYMQKLREAAEKGDKKSEEALQQYRATK